ncbi:MAG: glycerophosphodiester phosphodiesterase family protein [Clostridia bacterium]|nr:glycerophosphodiester phosphodiesterase family protein [Clostridia bacterium]
MRTIKKFSAILLIVLTAISVFTTTSCAIDYEDTPLSEIYKDHTGYTMVASRKGNTHYEPENSLSSVEQAVKDGADIVEIDIKKTSDGVLILMDDDTITRTCYGYGEKTAVAEMTYAEIKKLKLLTGKGGASADKTEKTVPSLEDVFKNRQNCLYLLDAEWELRNEIYTLAEKYDMLDSVIFYICDAKTDEIADWKSTLSTKPMIMTYFKGNVIFAATASVKNAAEVSDCIQLATKNPYGVIFGETVQETAYESSIRTMATPCYSELCGGRQDTAEYWDELISRGFNVILTDYAYELRRYVDDSHNIKALELKWITNMLVNKWELPDFNSDKFLDYKLAYTTAAEKAEELMSKDQSRSYSDCAQAIYELQKAYDDINANYEELSQGTAGMTVTPVRILLCVLAVAAVTLVEIFFYKKKKKA